MGWQSTGKHDAHPKGATLMSEIRAFKKGGGGKKNNSCMKRSEGRRTSIKEEKEKKKGGGQMDRHYNLARRA